jgi:hypothetical protein
VKPLLSAAVAVAGGLAGCAMFQGKLPPPAREPPPAPAVTPGQLDARALLGEFSARASRVGAGATSIAASGEVVENGWVGAFVDVPRDDCLLGYARAAPSVDDVDVAVYSDEGTALAVDEGRDVHPTVLLCTPHPDRVYLVAHVVEGEGLVAVGAQLVPRDRAEIVARALGARGGQTGGPRPASAWPGLDETIRAHRLELGGSWEEFKRVALPVDARLATTVSFPVDPDQCVDALVVADEGVSQLDVEVLDARGRVVARTRSAEGPSTLTVCSPVEMAGALSIRPHSGLGLAAVVLGRAGAEVARDLSSRPDLAWVAAAEPLEVARKGREALLARAGYDVPIGGSSGSLVVGHRASVPLDLRALGTPCGRIDVVGGAPLGLVDARVRDDAGVLLASEMGSSSLALFVCGRGVVRLELEALGRPGPFVATLRPEPWKAPAFSVHPLAASRMLTRSASGSAGLFSGKEIAVRPMSLSADRVTSWAETLPAGKCLQIVLGAQGEGAGVELRAFDDSGADVDRAEAAHSASVRACALPGAAVTLRIEARASAGRLEAIMGERTRD